MSADALLISEVLARTARMNAEIAEAQVFNQAVPQMNRMSIAGALLITKHGLDPESMAKLRKVCAAGPKYDLSPAAVELRLNPPKETDDE